MLCGAICKHFRYTTFFFSFFALHHNLRMSSVQQGLLPSSDDKGNQSSRDIGSFLLVLPP